MRVKLPKSLFESAQMFKADNDARFYLNGICFKSDGRVFSTNGYIGFIGMYHSSDIKSDLIVDVQKSPTKKYEFVVIDTESCIATFHKSEYVIVGYSTVKKIEHENYPDLDKVMKQKKQNCDEICFDTGYLSIIDRVAKNFSSSVVKFELSGASGAAIANITDGASIAKIAIMPFRV